MRWSRHGDGTRRCWRCGPPVDGVRAEPAARGPRRGCGTGRRRGGFREALGGAPPDLPWRSSCGRDTRPARWWRTANREGDLIVIGGCGTRRLTRLRSTAVARFCSPGRPRAPLAQLLSKEYAAGLRKRIDRSRTVAESTSGPPGGEDTVYLTVVDKDRNVVSFIQSIFSAFGSGLVAGDTGIVLHNRGAGFSFDPNHPNRLEGGKRPFHTLVPAMVFRDGKPWVTFGVMGGDMQTQGHVQVLLNLIDYGMDVQRAGEQPRFRHFESGLALESSIGQDVLRGLEAKGHRMVSSPGMFGGYQAIMIDPRTGALFGGSDPRKDGCALGW